jgi:hypothetical protein
MEINKIEFSVEFLKASTNPKENFKPCLTRNLIFWYILKVVFEIHASVSLCLLPVFPPVRNNSSKHLLPVSIDL